MTIQRPDQGGTLAALRASNRRHVLHALRSGEARSRSEIAAATGLSSTTVRTLVDELSRAGELETGAADRGRRGRPAQRFRRTGTSTTRRFVAGVAFQHDSLHVVVSPTNLTATAERGRILDPAASASACLHDASSFITDALSEWGATPDDLVGVTVGLPGWVASTSSSTRVRGAGVRWDDIAPAEMLAEVVGVPVTMHNDAQLAAVGEARFGAGRADGTVLYLKVDVGIGAAIAVDGRVHHADHGNVGGFLGHLPVVGGVKPCKCGRRGCLETEASGLALTAATGAALDPSSLTASDSPEVRAFRARAGRLVGERLASFCNFVQPHVVVLGGRLLGDDDDPTVVDPLVAATRAHLVPPLTHTPLVRARLRSRAEALGAAAIAADAGVEV